MIIRTTILFFIIIFSGKPLYADVIVGTAILAGGGWDFSIMQACEPFDGDIAIGIIIDLSETRICGMNGAKLICLPDSLFEELKYAPEDTTQYEYHLPAILGAVYVIITRHNYYAKIRFPENDYPFLYMDYVYQPDGSTKLFKTTAVKLVSWGLIKKLTKED